MYVYILRIAKVGDPIFRGESSFDERILNVLNPSANLIGVIKLF